MSLQNESHVNELTGISYISDSEDRAVWLSWPCDRVGIKSFGCSDCKVFSLPSELYSCRQKVYLGTPSNCISLRDETFPLVPLFPLLSIIINNDGILRSYTYLEDLKECDPFILGESILGSAGREVQPVGTEQTPLKESARGTFEYMSETRMKP